MSNSNAAAADSSGGFVRPWLFALLALGLLVCAVLQFKHLAYPLIWQDEGETAMLGRRVLEYGYPKVHDGRNVVYGMGVPLSVAVKEESDAYIGSLWGQYYFAAVAVWLAQETADPHSKTALLRLPFALVGSLGVVACFLAVAPAFSARRNARLFAAVGFTLLHALSISLILHLREVRYYALVMALLGAIVFLHLRRFEFDRPRLPAQPVLQALLLLLLFNVFYPACVAIVLWLVLEGLLRVRRANGVTRESMRLLVPILMPVLGVAALALPIAVYFEISSLSGIFSARYAFGPELYLGNLRAVLHYLLRYELLGLVLLVKLTLFALSRSGSAWPSAIAEPRRISALLGRLCLVYILVGAGNPIFFERYFVPLSPLLSLILLLDCACLIESLRARVPFPRRRRVMLMAATLMLVAVAGTGWLKRAELVGRWIEVSRPYRGPLDYVVVYLKERYEDPSQLRIATNYEAEAYMFYLDSEVVGRFHAESRQASQSEAAMPVDVVIPRKAQPKKLARLRPYLAQGKFVRRDFSIADLPYNNIPELFSGRVLSTTHFFREQSAPDAERALFIYERAER